MRRYFLYLCGRLPLLALALALCLALAPVQGQAADKPLIAAFGDSLSAGYGLPEQDGFAPQLQAALAALGAPATVINAAVSGDTSADGRRRVDWMLRKKPDIVIVALGANDMLRALPVPQMHDNLDAIITRIKQSGARVLLAGMVATPSLGEQYERDYAEAFRRLAESHQTAFYPFFLQDVAAVPALNLPDGLHPNREGIAIIAANIAPLLAQMLKE